MRCEGCKNWLLGGVTVYDDGSEIRTHEPPEGKGRCGVLDIDTPPNFGCTSYAEAAAGDDHVIRFRKSGAPWQHKRPGPCPDCKKPDCGYPNCKNPACPGGEKCLGLGQGASGADERCCGTGTVLYYDDGYVGENKTKMHPNERNLGKIHDAPTDVCPNCARSIDPAWNVCPNCGMSLRGGERVARRGAGLGGAIGGTA